MEEAITEEEEASEIEVALEEEEALVGDQGNLAQIRTKNLPTTSMIDLELNLVVTEVEAEALHLITILNHKAEEQEDLSKMTLMIYLHKVEEEEVSLVLRTSQQHCHLKAGDEEGFQVL